MPLPVVVEELEESVPDEETYAPATIPHLNLNEVSADMVTLVDCVLNVLLSLVSSSDTSVYPAACPN